MKEWKKQEINDSYAFSRREKSKKQKQQRRVAI